MHRTLVTSVSKPLDCLINGHMFKAQNGEAGLEEVDESTFARFCHWVYASFYPAAGFCDRPQDVALTEHTGVLNLHEICTVDSRFPQQNLPWSHFWTPLRLHGGLKITIPHLSKHLVDIEKKSWKNRFWCYNFASRTMRVSRRRPVPTPRPMKITRTYFYLMHTFTSSPKSSIFSRWRGLPWRVCIKRLQFSLCGQNV